MEAIGVLFILFVVWLVFKIAGGIFHAGFWLLALPFKLLALAISLVIGLVVFVPVVIIGSLLIIPVALLAGLFPFILLIGGLWLLLRRN
jgi:hypothetical protein